MNFKAIITQLNIKPERVRELIDQINDQAINIQQSFFIERSTNGSYNKR